MSDGERRRRIDQIRQQAQSLTELVEAVLNLARTEERRKKPQGQPVDMSRLVQNVLSAVQEQANSRQHEVNLTVPEKPPVVNAEPIDFHRIWRNLIDNAIKYTPSGGHIEVRMDVVDPALAPGGAVISLPSTVRDAMNGEACFVGQVADDGYGINAEDQAELFSRFTRGWAAQSNIPGTGLGLVLVRERLHLYGGDIHVDSAPGAGSVFTFWVPVGQAP